ncbi:MAG: MFS transporter [Acutalibacteraceae bacterium]|nr:MFS transporter [Acutalibacteraceae bacterium]
MNNKQPKPQNPLWQTNKAERKSYYTYFFGQNMIYNMIAGYLSVFLLLIGINPVKSAAVMLAVKVWDAVNDAIFGVIFDKIKFRSNQKYIPWLKIACAATPVATIAIFIIPTAASETVKLIWFALAYVIWDTAYTVCDVPAFGIITAMTSNIEERNTILSLKGITGGIGSALTTVLVSVLISEFVGLGYGSVSVIVAIVAMATMFPVCKYCQERNKSTDEEQFTVRKMIKYVVSNKYLLIYYLGYIFYSGAQTYNALHMITAYYIYENSLASLITGTVAAVPQLIMALLVPKIIRKIDKTKLFAISAVATVILSFLIIPTRNSFILFVVTFMLRSIPLGIVGVLSFTFTPDCAEYGQYTTGTEAKGITFAIQTFAVKLAAAISGSLGLALLGIFGFKTEFEINGIKQEVSNFADLEAINAISQQTSEALDGLWFTYNIVPIIGLVIALIIWSFYKLNDKDVQIMADCNVGKITKEEAKKLLSRKY